MRFVLSIKVAGKRGIESDIKYGYVQESRIKISDR